MIGEWFKNEIKELARYPYNNMVSAKRTEAIRIKQILKKEVEEVSDEICLRYCRFPEAYDDKSRMAKERCTKCPLLRLMM